jgi:hypothetical protein
MANIIKSLRNNEYLMKNELDYTKDIQQAGLFFNEELIDILKDFNTLGKVFSIPIEYSKIDDEDHLKSLPSKPFDKKPIQDVLEELGNTNSLETNPISLLLKQLEDNHYYLSKEHTNLKNFGSHINYGETLNQNLKIQNEEGLFIKMSIYRKDGGTYELNSYPNKEPKRAKVVNIKRNKP